MIRDRRDEILRQADRLAAAGDLNAAEREYRRAADLAPTDTRLQGQLGDLLVRAGKIDEAIALFEPVAEAYAETGFFLKAIAVYKKINRLDPTRTDTYEKLAALYFKQGLVVEGRQQLLTLAGWFLKLRNPREAARVYGVLADLEPSNTSARAKLADLIAELGEEAGGGGERAKDSQAQEIRPEPAQIPTGGAVLARDPTPSTIGVGRVPTSANSREGGGRDRSHGLAGREPSPATANQHRNPGSFVTADPSRENQHADFGSHRSLTAIDIDADATAPSAEGPRVVEALVAALREEIDRLSSITLSTIVIPEEGAFQLIKPLVGFQREIELKLTEYYYHDNVFLMMRFRESNHVLGEFIIECLRKHGLRGVRADQPEWNITRNVYNPVAVLYCCKYGIALFDEPEEDQAYSPNVAFELGIMQIQNKDCLILRHDSLPQVPFDLIKDLYRPYRRDLEVRRIIDSWASQVAGHRLA